MLLTVGIPARPKSPLDPKKDGESVSYSVLPLSDGPEGSTNSRPQVVVTKAKIKVYKIVPFEFIFFYNMGMRIILTVTSDVNVADAISVVYSNQRTFGLGKFYFKFSCVYLVWV